MFVGMDHMPVTVSWPRPCGQHVSVCVMLVLTSVPACTSV